MANKQNTSEKWVLKLTDREMELIHNCIVESKVRLEGQMLRDPRLTEINPESYEILKRYSYRINELVKLSKQITDYWLKFKPF